MVNSGRLRSCVAFKWNHGPSHTVLHGTTKTHSIIKDFYVRLPFLRGSSYEAHSYICISLVRARAIEQNVTINNNIYTTPYKALAVDRAGEVHFFLTLTDKCIFILMKSHNICNRLRVALEIGVTAIVRAACESCPSTWRPPNIDLHNYTNAYLYVWLPRIVK